MQFGGETFRSSVFDILLKVLLDSSVELVEHRYLLEIRTSCISHTFPLFLIPLPSLEDFPPCLKIQDLNVYLQLCEHPDGAFSLKD